MNKLLSVLVAFFFVACNESPTSGGDNPGSDEPSSSGATITASQIIANPGAYNYEMGDGVGWGKFGDECNDDEVPWVAAWKDKKKMTFDQVDFNMDADNVYLDILTESSGQQSFTVPMSELHFEVNVTDQMLVELNTLTRVSMASKECELGKGTNFGFDIIVKDDNGSVLTPKKEIVKIDESKTYFSYSEWSRTLDFESCKEGYAAYVSGSEDFGFDRRASVVDGELLLEAQEYLEEDSKLTHAISLENPKLEIVKTSSGYSLTYEFDTCGDSQYSIITLDDITQEEWEDLF
jgi:hypothetical protein